MHSSMYGMQDKYDKFTERARKVLSLAQEEAQLLNHNYIGTEHLLLGLVREGDGVAAKVLASLGVELESVRNQVLHVVGRGDRLVLGEIGLTPRTKKVIELAVDEARRMNHHYIGTEHLLLGLVREGEGIAAGALESLGVNLEKVRVQTLAVLGAPGGQQERQTSTSRSRWTLRRRPQQTIGGEPSDELLHVFNLAQVEAEFAKREHVGEEHLLLGVALQGTSYAARALANHGASIVALRRAVDALPAPTAADEQGTEPNSAFNEPASRTIEHARELASNGAATNETGSVDANALLLALLTSQAPNSRALAALRQLGIDPPALASEVSRAAGGPQD